MPWDWIAKGAKRIEDIGAEYTQHAAFLERLLALEPGAADDEFGRAWPAMSATGHAGVKMTLAGLTLKHQAAARTADAAARGERLKHLQSLIAQADRATPIASAGGASTESSITASAAKVTQKVAAVAERARPRAEAIFDSARKGIEQHAPAIEAAVKGAVNELLKAGGKGTPASAPPAPPVTPPPVTPPPIPPDPPASARATPAAPTSGTPGIAGQWHGTLRRGTDADDSLGCELRVAASGRPLWAYTDTNGFHAVELKQLGQEIQYVPPDKGVVTVLVQSVTGSATETGYVVDYSFERASNGYMEQRYQRITLTGRARGTQMDVVYSETGISSFGDKTGLAAGGTERRYTGTLTKQP